MTNRLDDLEVDGLLKVVLVLAAIWLTLEIVGEIATAALGVFGSFRPVIALAILALVLLWYFDRL